MKIVVVIPTAVPALAEAYRLQVQAAYASTVLGGDNFQNWCNGMKWVSEVTRGHLWWKRRVTIEIQQFYLATLSRTAVALSFKAASIIKVTGVRSRPPGEPVYFNPAGILAYRASLGMGFKAADPDDPLRAFTVPEMIGNYVDLKTRRMILAGQFPDMILGAVE